MTSPFHVRTHLLSKVWTVFRKHYVLCFIVWTTERNHVANPVACHGSTELATPRQGLTIPGFSDVGRERLSDILGAFSFLRTIPPELPVTPISTGNGPNIRAARVLYTGDLTVLCRFGITFAASAATEELPLGRRIFHGRARIPPFSLFLYCRSFIASWKLGYRLPRFAVAIVWPFYSPLRQPVWVIFCSIYHRHALCHFCLVSFFPLFLVCEFSGRFWRMRRPLGVFPVPCQVSVTYPRCFRLGVVPLLQRTVVSARGFIAVQWNHTYRKHLVRGGAMRPLRHTNFDSCGDEWLDNQQSVCRERWRLVLSFFIFETSQAFLFAFCSSSCKQTRNKDCHWHDVWSQNTQGL